MKKSCFILSFFEPFDDCETNSSQIIAESLSIKENNPFELKKILLPVSFESVKKEIPKILKTYQPKIWLALGQSKGRDKVCLERIAQNIIHIPKGDNKKKVYHHQTIMRGKPIAYFLKYPWARLEKQLSIQNFPIQISYFSGSHLCNALSYLVTHTIAHKRLSLSFSFVHLPLLPEQNLQSENIPTLSHDTQTKVIQAIIDSLTDQKFKSLTNNKQGKLS